MDNQNEKMNIQEGYVDLDLPSGTLWATCNVGAERPEEYGLYFQWGDTVGYTGHEAETHSFWQTAPFNWGMLKCNPDFGSLKRLICPKGILLPKYDAVYQATGGKAHMPTKEQCVEMLHHTRHEWVAVNGVMGGKFTSKKDSTKYIFIPASGCYYSGNGGGDGEWTGLWSSNLIESYPSGAWLLYFNKGKCYMSNYYRYYGFCVRGVIG